MPKAESVRGAFDRISSGLSFISEKKEKKKDRELQFEKLMADIENMKAGREIQQEGLRLEGERMDISQEQFGKNYELALRKELRAQKMDEHEIDKIVENILKSQSQRALIGAQEEGERAGTAIDIAKLPGVEADAATKVAKGRLDTSAFDTLYRGLNDRPPQTLLSSVEAPVDPEKLRKAKEITGIGRPPTSAGQVTDKDKWKAYQALKKVVTLMGEPAYTDEQAWKIVNAESPAEESPIPEPAIPAPVAPSGAPIPAPAAITPTPEAATPAAITPAGPTPTGVPAAVSEQELNPADFIPAGDTQPRAGLPVDTGPTPSTDIQPEDTPEIMASKIEATLGAFNKLTPEQQRAMERNMHTDYPDRAVKVMAILRGQ